MFKFFLKKVSAESKVAQSNLWKDSWYKFKKNKLAIGSAIAVLILLLVSIFVPYFLPWHYDQIDWQASYFPAPPCSKHWLGTDADGRDILVRSLIGLRVSFSIGLLASAVSLCIGVPYASIAGFIGGKTDQIMMRIVDVFLTLPFMFFVILIMVVFGRHFFLIFVSLGLIGWPIMARIIRAETIAVKNKDFINAAVSYGANNFQIIWRHIIPNTLSIVIIYLTLTIPEMILTESFLSFLGLGVQEPMTSLGMLISDGSKVLDYYPWMFWPPTIILSIVLFCFNFIGDGIRDALDPKQK